MRLLPDGVSESRIIFVKLIRSPSQATAKSAMNTSSANPEAGASCGLSYATGIRPISHVPCCHCALRTFATGGFHYGLVLDARTSSDPTGFFARAPPYNSITRNRIIVKSTPW